MAEETLRKVFRNLEKKTPEIWPIAIDRRGYAEFIGYIFKISRLAKPSVWFCVDIWNRTVKRICV